MAKKNTAIQKVTPGSITPMEDWEVALAEQAKNEKSQETLGIPRITHDNGIIKIDSKPVADNKLSLAIVDFVFSKSYFKEKYVKGKAQVPVCYGYGRKEEEVLPHAAAPEKVCESCKGCEHNKFFTAEIGKGKRCKDERKLLCVVATDDPESIQAAEMRTLSIPPGSLKNWGKYLAQISEVSPYGVRGVMTEISTEPGASGAYAITFKPVDRLAKETVREVVSRSKGADALLMTAWPKLEAQEEQAQRSDKARSKVRGGK